MLADKEKARRRHIAVFHEVWAGPRMGSRWRKRLVRVSRLMSVKVHKRRTAREVEEGR